MSDRNVSRAQEQSTSYTLDFYSGATLVGTVNNGDIISLEITRSLFSEKPTWGQANAGELEAEFFTPAFTIPRMARVVATCT